MPAPCPYQAVILDPSGSEYGAILRTTLIEKCAELGLSLGENLVVLDEHTYATAMDRRAPTAGVYYGIARTDACTEVAEAMRRAAIPVLPMVRDLNDCKTMLPQGLKRLNAHRLDPQDKQQNEAASWLAEELGLLPTQRLLFISYRRDDSIAVAQQLDRALDSRLFKVFLDTHSIRRGALFQAVIEDRMADADVMIFLDTPNALTSRWVAEELTHAHRMGLGVFHIIWPEHQPYRELELSKQLSLTREDFNNGVIAPGQSASLKEDTVGAIISEIESFRAQAFAARRTRVIKSFHRQVEGLGIQAVVDSDHCIQVQIPGQPTASIHPVVGHPSTLLMEKVHRKRSGEVVSLVYDQCGLIEATAQHLRWLNEHVPVKTVPLTEVEQWMSKLIPR